MALQLTVKTPQGFDAVDAYHRVEELCLPVKTKIRFLLKSYKTQNEKFAFEYNTLETNYDLNGKNPIAQAYEFVKSLSDFADAKDC